MEELAIAKLLAVNCFGRNVAIFCQKRFALTCQTPMMAFIIRITRITKGSTNAVVLSSPSSNNASIWKQIVAHQMIIDRQNCNRTVSILVHVTS